jgi:hypothetical protein
MLGVLAARLLHLSREIEDAIQLICGERLDGEQVFHGLGQ